MTPGAAPRSARSHELTAHLLLVFVVLVWGATFPVVKAALVFATPLAFNLARMALATVLLAALNYKSLRGLLAREGRPALAFGLAAGVFMALGYQFQTAGLKCTTPSKSAFITGLVVVLVPLLSAVPGIAQHGDPKPGWAAFAGAAIGFVGLVLLTTPPGSGAGLLNGLGRGEWLTLGCAVAFALHLLTLARAASQVGARTLATLQIAFCTLVMLVTLPLGGRPQLHLNLTVSVALGTTALLGTAVAFTVQSYAQQHLPATHTALILTLEPVFAWLTSLLFLGEHLGTRSLAGAAFILGGILLAELGPKMHPERANFAANP